MGGDLGHQSFFLLLRAPERLKGEAEVETSSPSTTELPSFSVWGKLYSSPKEREGGKREAPERGNIFISFSWRAFRGHSSPPASPFNSRETGLEKAQDQGDRGRAEGRGKGGRKREDGSQVRRGSRLLSCNLRVVEKCPQSLLLTCWDSMKGGRGGMASVGSFFSVDQAVDSGASSSPDVNPTP